MSQAKPIRNDDLMRLRQLGEKNPDQLAHFIGQLTRAKDVGRLLPIADALGVDFRHSSPVQQALGEAFVVARQIEKAVEFAQHAVAADPENPRRIVNLALTYLGAGRPSDAERTVQGVSEEKISESGVLAALASVFFQLRKYEEAAACYEKAITLKPNNAAYYYSLAALQRFLGAFDKAEALFDKAVELNPREYEAYYIRSGLRIQTQERNHLLELQKLLDAGIEEAKGEVFVCFALAKEYEDVGNYEQSFRFLKRGSDLRRRHLEYRVDADEAIIDEIVSRFTPEAMASTNTGCSTSEPIFLISLPRTGSTLLERMLSSHSSVSSAGELSNFSKELSHLLQAENEERPKSTIEQVRMSLELNMNELGVAYLESTRDVTGSTPHFVDKLPFNYLNVGLIAAALPNAKILHMTRSPMDACYAIYKTLFQRAYPFSYNLEELARYYIAYHRLMTHWRAVLPGKVLDVAYEDLVSDPETQLRRVFEHCGLSWEAKALDFHESKEVATTASASQVRQPVHQKSVGLWRCYEKQLGELKSKLEHAGVPVS